ncbi:DUF6114 domain-containing protein [Streptomyces sp. NPDC006332]|uniref:DUF6114 domain-containing protein n=1 Tax=Streptomyces sp. NPDC006332 TaxID=3155456 RepID=UPI0033B53435
MSGRPGQDAGSGFRQWRARRPFWGGLLLALGGAEILLTEKASLKVVMHIGMQGLAGYLLPGLMVLLGLLILFNPSQRLFYSITGILLSLGTWLTSNLGGFFIGLLLGAVGSCLAFGWLPDQAPRVSRRQRRRTAREAKELGTSAEQTAQDETAHDETAERRAGQRQTVESV